jgi:hypothetical protein
MNETYDRYRQLKKSLSIRYRGIDISQVLAIYLWIWSAADAIDGIEETEAEQALDLSFLQGIEEKKIIYYDIDRKDHQVTFHNICSCLGDDYRVIDIAFGIRYKPHRSVVNKCLSWLFVKRAAKHYSFSRRERELLAYRVCFVLNSIDELYAMKQQLSHVSHFVAYSAIHPWNSLLCQFFMRRGAKVFGLSHAVHYVYTRNIPIHCLNYENLDVDCCLTWGQYTKDEYRRFGVKAKEILVAGYPKQIEVQQAKETNKLKRCLVLLSNPDYEESNRKLLALMSGHADTFVIYLKLHPSDDPKKYKSQAENRNMKLIDRDIQLTECFDREKYDFAIAVNTTSYYEIMAAGIPCLRYRDGDAYQMTYGDERDEFGTDQEFCRAIGWLKEQVRNQAYDEVVQNILRYVMGLGENNYRKYLS